MAGFVYPPYTVYSSYGGPFKQNQPPRPRQPSWKQSKGGGVYLPPPPTPPPAPEPSDYLDNYKRAQLKAILSQVTPGLTPRLRRANTREVGVQVNPRVDASVQCSLGPRTLWRRGGGSPSRSATLPPGVAILRSPGGSSEVRFTRPIAVYSPVSDRRIFTLPPGGGRGPRNRASVAPVPREKGVLEEPEAKSEAEKPVQALEGTAVEADQIHEEQAEEIPGAREGKRAAFQFLEQKYGYFHCKDCKTRWESAYVWCISGSSKVYFKQLCRKCQKGFNPYRVEAIQCQACSKSRCSCPQKKRHIDLKRPHRQELCGRCKDKRLSCDNTYSFKYIV
ncbi:protein ZAR1-like [Ambystoma mexicanum]|uniref:protein ZAR1-like n=1 Tax=Ambystoma mexicanum TaxID=8296 RepID=UPI0037E8D92B